MKTPDFTASCPIPISQYPHVVLAHGGGGKLMHQLIGRMFLEAFRNPLLETQHDAAVFEIAKSGGGASSSSACVTKASQPLKLAFTTDSYVVRPLFFPGGDIGSMAIHGTVNDLAMAGARPVYLSSAFIIEEGLPMETLWQAVCSMRDAAKKCGVQIVTGDTKVVDKGKGDGLFINTTGIGIVPHGLDLSADRAQAGDKVVLSGSIGDHGIAILAQREGLEFESAIESDSAALHTLTAEMLKIASNFPEGGEEIGHPIRCMRDPTRGGLSSTLNEIAEQSRVGIGLMEASIPVREEVRGACEMLGLDPLYVANEGKLVAIVAPEFADELVEIMRRHPLGKEARIIGEVTEENGGLVTMRTALGTTRIVDMLAGDQLPRIC